ncbi:uncharacterized protein LOC127836826 isoform X4 [Dreissena polymorpha]|uniref:uncharacterized protein LOC127836826 isoform X4 n=1 Tax=Dreissena polymorpha TaxID=45954 RepID=UPI002263E006|nr:uncharacterized protein LOC127836826 isoform X4 [Dreissena polymorpha]
MDTNLDYLMPTCMLGRKKGIPQGFKLGAFSFENNNLPSVHVSEHIFDDALKALESDTCSEISNTTYADAAYYTKMKLWDSPFLERQFHMDVSEYKPPWERDRTTPFDKSLQMFLKWPEAERDENKEIREFHKSLRSAASRQRSFERKKRSASVKKLLQNKILSRSGETDSDDNPVSEHDDTNWEDSSWFENEDVEDDTDVERNSCGYELDRNVAKTHEKESNFCTEILRHNLIRPPSSSPKGAPKQNDSDSDYKTLSDTSMDQFEQTFNRNSTSEKKKLANNERLESLKGVMSSISKRSESIVRKVGSSKTIQELFSNKKDIKKLKTPKSVFEDAADELMRTLGKRDGELDNFRDLLNRAEKSLALSEQAVEALQRELEKERSSKDTGSNKDNELSSLRKELSRLHAELEQQAQSHATELQKQAVTHKAQLKELNDQARTYRSQLDEMAKRHQDQLDRQTSLIEGMRDGTFHGKMGPFDMNLHITSNHVTSFPDHSDPPSQGSQSPTDGGHMNHHRNPFRGHRSRDSSSLTESFQERGRNDRSSNGFINGLSGRPSDSQAQDRTHLSDLQQSDEISRLRSQVNDLVAKNSDLELTLRATEETVRCQTQKMKLYRGMLVESGSIPRSRSQSLPQSPVSGIGSGSPPPEMQRQSRSPTRKSEGQSQKLPRFRSASPLLGAQTDILIIKHKREIEALQKENAKLKQQIDGYQKVLNVFQSRSPSPGDAGSNSRRSSSESNHSTSDMSTVDGEPISTESASCIVESWVGLLNKFLDELGENQGYRELPLASVEVSRLKRGLAQVRGALHSLTDTPRATDPRGRLSPDSGCSDNAQSGPNTLKSPLTSPGRSNNAVDLTSSQLSVTSPNRSSQSSSKLEHSETYITSPRLSNGKETSLRDEPSPSDHTLKQSNIFEDSESPSNSGKNASYRSGSCSSQQTAASSLYKDKRSSVDAAVKDPASEDSMLAATRISHFFRTRANSSYPGMDFTRDESLNFDNDGGDSPDAAIVPDPLRFGISKPLQDSTVSSVSSAVERGSQRLTMQSTDSCEKLRHCSEKTIANDFSINSINTLSSTHSSTFRSQTASIPRQKVIPEISVTRPSFERIDVTNMSPDRLEMTVTMEEIQTSPEDGSSPENGSLPQTFNVTLMDVLGTRRHNASGSPNKDLFQNTFSTSFIEGVGDQTLNPDASAQCIQDISTNITSDQENKRDMKRTLETMEKVLTSFSEGQGHGRGSRSFKDLETELMKILKQLQEQLEQSLIENQHIAEQLMFYYQSSVSSIQDQDRQLSKYEQLLIGTNKKLEEKTMQLKNKDSIVSQLQVTLNEFKMSSTQDRTDIATFKTKMAALESERNTLKTEISDIKTTNVKLRSQVKSLETEQANSKDIVEKLKANCHNLMSALEQYKKRSEQLVEDNKNHMEAVYRHQNKVRDLEDVLSQKKSMEMQWQARVAQLESDLDLQLENEDKNHSALNDEKSRASKLAADLKAANDALTKREQELQVMKERVSVYKQNAESQMSQLKTKYDQAKQVLKEEINYREKVENEKNSALKNCQMFYDYICKLKKEKRSSERKIQEILTLLQREKEQQNNGSEGSREDVLLLLRSVNQRLPPMIEENQKISSDVKAVLKDWDQLLSGRSEYASSLSEQDNSQDFDQGFEGNLTWPQRRNVQTPDDWSKTLPLRDITPSLNESGSGSLPLKKKKSDENRKLGEAGYQEIFSVPGPIYRQGISDRCLIYNVNDKPEYLSGLTQVRIDSDQRSLFAIGMIDTFEKLRKETNECSVILRGASTRINERLKVFTTGPATESLEYSVLKELAFAMQNLNICVDSQQTAIGFFWTSELPAPNQHGEFVNQKLLDQVAYLKNELGMLRKKYESNAGQEDQICRSLESTLDVVTRAKYNLQRQMPGSPR